WLRAAICADTTLNVVAELQLNGRPATPDEGYVLAQGVSQNKSTYFWDELRSGLAAVPLFDADLTLNVVAVAHGHYFHKLGISVRADEPRDTFESQAHARPPLASRPAVSRTWSIVSRVVHGKTNRSKVDARSVAVAEPLAPLPLLVVRHWSASAAMLHSLHEDA